MKVRYTLGFGIVLSAVVLGILLANVDLARVGAAFESARYAYVVPSALVLALGMAARAVRWQRLLVGRLPLRHAFSILNVSYLLNGALPFRLGEVARVFLANRMENPVPVVTLVSTIVVERLLDMLAVIGILGVALALLDVPTYIASAGLLLGAAALVGMIGLAVVARYPGLAYWLLNTTQRFLPFLKRWDLAGMVARFIEGLSPLTRWQSALEAIGWSLVSWGLSVAAGYVLMYAFFPQASWLTTLLFIALASLAVSVPAAPGAVGPYEAGVVMALTWTGYDQPAGTAVAFAVVLHVMTTGVFVVLGVLGLLDQGVTLGQVMQGARNVAPAPNGGGEPTASPTPID